jgi:hypothetical protein
MNKLEIANRLHQLDDLLLQFSFEFPGLQDSKMKCNEDPVVPCQVRDPARHFSASSKISVLVPTNKRTRDNSTSQTITMPPRLMALPTQLSQFIARPFTQVSPLAFLTPTFQQSRNASILSSLSDNPTAYNKRIRRGRGPASGKGKTSGRGHKGQKQHGKVPARFNGGQTPDIVVHGERGWNNMYVFPPVQSLPQLGLFIPRYTWSHALA